MRRALPVILLALALGLFALDTWRVQPQLDDAYISYRYARNLVVGNGLVYNMGEYVEGFTNLLWTLLVSGGIALGVPGVAVGHALGVASGLAALIAAFVYASAGLRTERRWVAALAPWVLICSPAFMLWSTSGMELPLFTAAVTAALAAQARSRWALATVALSVATLTRPEGALLAAVVYGTSLRRFLPPAWSTWRYPTAYACLIVLLTCFRLAYYGAPLPNTFYAKVGGVPLAGGLRYAAEFFWDSSILLLIPAVFAAMREPRWRAGAVWVVAMVAYIVSVGGDPFSHYRLIPVLPILAAMALRGALLAWDERHELRVALGACVVAAAGEMWLGTLAGVVLAFLGCGTAAVAASTARRRAMGFAAAAGLALLLSSNPLEGIQDASSVAKQFDSTRRARRLAYARQQFAFAEAVGYEQALTLRKRGKRDALVAAAAIGSLGFYSDLPILDIFGLIDATVARSRAPLPEDVLLLPGHQRADADYVFSREPEYILIPRPGFNWRFPANVTLWEHPSLAAAYEWDEELRGYRRRVLPSPQSG